MTTTTSSYFEIASKLPPDSVLTFHDVSWEEYEDLIERLGEAAGMRVSFDEGVLTVMTLSPEHENYARFIDSLITVIRLTPNDHTLLRLGDDKEEETESERAGRLF